MIRKYIGNIIQDNPNENYYVVSKKNKFHTKYSTTCPYDHLLYYLVETCINYPGYLDTVEISPSSKLDKIYILPPEIVEFFIEVEEIGGILCDILC